MLRKTHWPVETPPSHCRPKMYGPQQELEKTARLRHADQTIFVISEEEGEEAG